MSKPSFTPGPWSQGSERDWMVFAGQDGESGELVGFSGGRDGETNKANARLIASAPDLLQALLIATSKPLAEHCTDEEWEIIRSALMTAQGEA